MYRKIMNVLRSEGVRIGVCLLAATVVLSPGSKALPGDFMRLLSKQPAPSEILRALGDSEPISE